MEMVCSSSVSAPSTDMNPSELDDEGLDGIEGLEGLEGHEDNKDDSDPEWNEEDGQKLSGSSMDSLSRVILEK
jgi:hypothetical protein